MEILVITNDDDPRSRHLVAVLAGGGHATTTSSRAGEGEHVLRTHRFDAVLIDVSLQGADVIERLRRRGTPHAVVAWTPSPSSALVAELLERGADEVLTATMGEPELLARLEAAARRKYAREWRPLEVGPLRIDVVHGEVSWAGRQVQLTQREREVLHVLAESAGRTVQRARIYGRVWGYAMPRGDRSVDVNVKRLRTKLARLDEAPLAIRTQPGVGYRLELATDQTSVTAL